MERCLVCGADTRPGDSYCLNCGQRLLARPLLNNRYEVFEEVGQGGMGKIYKAQDIKLGNRYVAVKELKVPGLQSPREFERASRLFEQEALLLARLNHPSLPHVYDHFSEGGHWYFVMEYIEGQTLAQRLRNMPGRRLPPDEVLDIGVKLCDVLDYLHSYTPPIVFSDLKPANIIITPKGDPYLIDFGIARFLGDPNADDWKFISRGYSPPEQYQTTQINPRADIYSLGATLYQMVSGRPPLKFVPLQLEYQFSTMDLEALILSMTQQYEQKRPQDINTIKQALQRIADQWAQELSTLRKSSPWGEETFGRKETSFSQTSVFTDSSALLTSVTFRDIQLSLDQVDALAWSPDGAHLAAAKKNGEVHIYAWPPEEKLYNSSEERLLPTRTWSLKEEQRADSRSTAVAWSPDGAYFAVAAGIKVFILDISLENSLSVYTEHKHEITAIAWSPDGKFIASVDCTLSTQSHVYVWEVETKRVKNQYNGPEVNAMAWSPDSTYLAFAVRGEPTYRSRDDDLAPIPEPDYDTRPDPEGFPPPEGSEHDDLSPTEVASPVKEPDPEGFPPLQEPERDDLSPTEVAFPVREPDPEGFPPLQEPGRYGPFVSLSWAGVQVFEVSSGNRVCYYHEQYEVQNVKWLPEGTNIVSCASDGTIHIWNARTAQKLWSLEGHTDIVLSIAFLDHDHLLASLSSSGGICLWNINNWAQVGSYRVDPPFQEIHHIAFHPTTSLMVTFGGTVVVRLYKIDTTQLYAGASREDGVQYTNAKVVLLGDSGVGKSGLGLVLSRHRFEPTESTHGRLVWTFSRDESRLPDGRREIRETLLWDLAGQPGYRLTHQLHLSEVTVALVVFDAHSETDPLAGISHWVRALRTAQRVRGNMAGLKMLLVLARIDRGGKRVSRGRIDDIVQKAGFDAYFETSAKEGTNVAELCNAIDDAIDWEQLPKVTSTELFQRIRTFLIAEKQTEQLLTTVEDLYRTFLRTWSSWGEEKDLLAEFVTGTKLLESSGLIRRLNFGNFVLLQPELLDAYASALVNAVRDEPDGLGDILEETVRAGNFFIPTGERIADREQEKLLLIAMVEDLLSYEIALREQGDEGPRLVFPSESTREHPGLPNPENASIVFTFEGPILNIYATLAVRLSHSNLFTRKELWKDAVIYEAMIGGTCGIWLKLIEDGRGELTLFFDRHASQETCFHFEEYVRVHLQRKALAESVQSRRIRRCEVCSCTISDQIVRMRKGRGLNWCNCPVCDALVDLRDPVEQLRRTSKSQVPEMDRAADAQRTRATAQSTVQGKQETNDFDVFLCYNPPDRATVIEIGERLKERGILPWLDVWELRPGLPWQRQLEQQIEQIKTVAVFVGKDGIGPWQQQEMEAFLRQFVSRECPVIPVILNDTLHEPELPLFLKAFTWVDFRRQELRPMEQLTFGITGQRGLYR
jgi:serine/threonine protein kinase/GTPase SAR1 family protein